MNIIKLRELLKGHPNIEVVEFEHHAKASESSVEVTFHFDGRIWRGLVPYFYRRTGLFIETEEELAAYLLSIVPYFESDHMKKWIDEEKKLWDNEYAGRDVTKGFFDATQIFMSKMTP